MTVKNGYADGTTPNHVGGGLLCQDSSPAIRHCIIECNAAGNGGGVSAWTGGAPTIAHCTIRYNWAITSAPTGSNGCGGMNIWLSDATVTDCAFYLNAGLGNRPGALVIGQCRPVITRCTFEGNETPNRGGAASMWGNAASPQFVGCTFVENRVTEPGGIGGAVLVENGCPATFRDCTFTANEAVSKGGGMAVTGSTSHAKLVQCTFTGNEAPSGGGLSVQSSQATAVNCRFLGNQGRYGGGAFVSGSGGSADLTNCLFSGNAATSEGSYALGGGLCVVNSASAEVTNCTLSGNTASGEPGDTFGGGIYMEQSTVSVENSIVWGNTVLGSSSENAQIFEFYGTTVNLLYSCVQNWTSGGLGGSYNTASDPLLADADGYDNVAGTADDDLHLLSNSPCENSGSNAAVPPDVLDLDGDGDTTEPTPLDLDRFGRFLGTGPTVDMGAYEYAVRDCNNNQVADHVDIAVGTSNDCNANAVPDECELTAGTATDCDVNGTLDECDLMVGDALDCNENGVPDECDITGGTSQDGNQNGTPDECEEIPVPYRVEYGYDYMGRRVRRQSFEWDAAGAAWVGPVMDTKYVYDGWRVIEELDGNSSDATTRQYTWGLDLAAQAGAVNSLEQAGGIGGLLALRNTSAGYGAERSAIYFYDANGNVGQVVTITAPWYGEIYAHYEYTPYGQVLVEPLFDQPYRFSTKPFDSWTGLGYWGYRWYSPKLGRWVMRDPVGEGGGPHAFAFAENRPSSIIDSAGLWGEDVHRGDTTSWAYEVGFSKKCAEIIGTADNEVDRYLVLVGEGTGPMYLVGDFRYHFDTNKEGTAVEAHARDGRIAYELGKAEAALRDASGWGDVLKGLSHIGRALHPLQDKFSHNASHQAETPFHHAPAEFCRVLGDIDICKDARANNPNWVDPHRPDRVLLWPADHAATREATKTELRKWIDDPAMECYCKQR